MPTLANTPNNNFRYPSAANNGTDFATGLLDLADDVDVMWSAGTIASRPAAGVRNRVYYGTDTTLLYWDDATHWHALSLATTSTSTSTTAADGQNLVVTGSSAVTITLPAHLAGQRVRVLNLSSGGSTVSGTNIQGIGLTLASSFKLGTVGAAVHLLDDGTNWYIVSGQQDTGWQALSLATNITAGTITPSARLIGDRVYMKGELINNTGSTDAGTLATIPVGLRPPSILSFPAIWSIAFTIGFVTINSSGQLGGGGSSGLTNGSVLYLDGLSYPLT